jgi:hypothetical protein
MRIRGTIWRQKIVDTLAKKHHITPDEGEQVLKNQPQYRFLEEGRVEGEHMYVAYGRTDAGCYVIVIFLRKPRNRALIMSARDMESKERSQYGREHQRAYAERDVSRGSLRILGYP